MPFANAMTALEGDAWSKSTETPRPQKRSGAMMNGKFGLVANCRRGFSKVTH